MGSRRSHDHFSHAPSEKKVDNGLIFIKKWFFCSSRISSNALGAFFRRFWLVQYLIFWRTFYSKLFFFDFRKIKKNRRIIMEKVCWIACFVSVYLSVMKFFQKNILRKKWEKIWEHLASLVSKINPRTVIRLSRVVKNRYFNKNFCIEGDLCIGNNLLFPVILSGFGHVQFGRSKSWYNSENVKEEIGKYFDYCISRMKKCLNAWILLLAGFIIVWIPRLS